MTFAELMGALAGFISTSMVFLGCIDIYEGWSGWSLDDLKDIWPGVALVLLGIGVIPLFLLVVVVSQVLAAHIG